MAGNGRIRRSKREAVEWPTVVLIAACYGAWFVLGLIVWPAYPTIALILLGVVGWVLGRYGYSASPIVLGLILGPIAEQGFVQAWTIGAAREDLFGMFFGRPLSIGIIVFTAFSLLSPIFLSKWKRRSMRNAK